MSEFLAEARILVRPDTTGFRAELEAALKSVTATPITIPVVAAVAPGKVSGVAAAAQAAAAGQTAVAEAAQAAGAASQTAAASTVRLTAAQNAAAVAAQKLAFAQSEVIGAETAVSASRVTLTRSTAAVAAAQKAVEVAVRGTDAALIASTKDTLALAAAQQLEAKSALAAARAEAARGTSLGQLGRGAGGAGLSLFGLRGATLAASGAFLAGTAAIVGFSKAIKSAADLETELNVFRVSAGATADEMERVSAAAAALGRDITLPGVTASAAATAMTELAKAGLSVEDSLNGARGALQLATAAQIDVSESTNLVAGALNSFELAGTDAVKVADLFTGAAKASQGEITDMATALGQASAVANSFGVSIEDTVTLLTELAQAGIAGGRAGTSLRVAFLRLINPPADAAKALKELNVQNKILNADGSFNVQIFAAIEKALNGYTAAQRNALRATIFGADAIRTQAIIGSKGADAFERTREAVTAAGQAQELAGARTQGFNGDVENLANQVEALGLNVGKVAKGPIGLLVRGLGAATGAINDTTAAAEKKGVFEAFGDAISKFASSAERLGTGFNRAVIASTQASTAFTIFDGIAQGVTETTDALAQSLREVGSLLSVNLPQDSGLGVKQIQNVVEGFDAKATRDKIAKNTTQLLADLNEERAFLIRQLNRDFVKNRPALKRALEQDLLGTQNEIDQILKQQTTDNKKIADDAKAAATARDQAILSSQSVARDQRQNRVDAASQTPGLQDDIAQEKKLRTLVLQQIANVKTRIKDETTRKEALVALNSILISVDGTIKSLIQQQKENRADQRRELLQGIDLDIELADVTGNQAAEVRARNHKIAELNRDLQKEKKAHGTSTVLYKSIALEIARQNAAKKEIQGEVQKGQSFAQATFEFLQTQQGFASNLLGNLIPTGATGGLVGGGAPVSAALTPVAGAADGQSKSGPTAGQAQTTNSILLGILHQLKTLNGDNTSPEASRQNRGQRSVMDTGGSVG